MNKQETTSVLRTIALCKANIGYAHFRSLFTTPFPYQLGWFVWSQSIVLCCSLVFYFCRSLLTKSLIEKITKITDDKYNCTRAHSLWWLMTLFQWSFWMLKNNLLVFFWVVFINTCVLKSSKVWVFTNHLFAC